MLDKPIEDIVYEGGVVSGVTSEGEVMWTRVTACCFVAFVFVPFLIPGAEMNPSHTESERTRIW